MALYTYTAISAEGRRIIGRIDALNLVDLEMRLKRMELDLVTGEPEQGAEHIHCRPDRLHGRRRAVG